MVKKPLTFVIGHSGAGITSALKVLQDLGFLVMDNFPLHLISSLLSDPKNLDPERYVGFAFGVHSTQFHPRDLPAILSTLSSEFKVDVIFLSCSKEVLEQRFSVTRRPHPFLAKTSSLKESIAYEQQLLRPLEAAHEVIDTTHLSPIMLSHLIGARVQSDQLSAPMLLIFKSFGFKHQIYMPGDYVFDVRFLKNPYFVQELRDLNGLARSVRKYVRSDPHYQGFLQHVITFLSHTIPLCQQEKRSYVRIAVGCTGGVHRSVTVVEDLRQHYQKEESGLLIHTHHDSLESRH